MKKFFNVLHMFLKQLQSFVTIILLCELFFYNTSFVKVIDRSLAIINGEHILLSEFESTAKFILEDHNKLLKALDEKKITEQEAQELMLLQHGVPFAKTVKEQKELILDIMIDDKLKLQEAKKYNIKVSKRELEEGIKTIKARFATEADFQAELVKKGLTQEKFEQQKKDEIMVIKLITEEVEKKISQPTEDEVKELFKLIEKKIANEKLSDLGSSEERNINLLAKLIKRQFGELVQIRHILIKCDRNTSLKEKTDIRKKLADIRRRIDSGEDFCDLAKIYSEDAASKDRGGDIGYIARGEMPPEFEKVAFSLDVGKVSDIVETDFGYHLIKVEAKKASRKISFDEIRNDLSMFLYRERAKKKYDEWLKSLRQKAKITINPIE